MHGLVKNPLLNISKFFLMILMFPKENMSKLNNKDEKYTFIGYNDATKGYTGWNPITKKTIYFWDVVFRDVRIVFKQGFQLREE
jgi:hypothetical protein